MIDDFSGPLDAHWTSTCIGGAQLSLSSSILRFELTGTQRGHYADAQIDDYHHLSRSAFPWRPPLRMVVRARSSLPAATPDQHATEHTHLQGTAGFGFWNYPFSVRGDILMLPEAIWFFYASPSSNMALVPGSPGYGWKAQVVHSMRPASVAAALPTALTIGWSMLSGSARPASRWLQRFTGACEALIPVEMTEWHEYTLEWREQVAAFWVDGVPLLRVSRPPVRPLGFVAWLDNQYAVLTPRGAFRMGTVATGPEWFELDWVRIERV